RAGRRGRAARADRRDRAPLSGAGRALRQHRLAPGPDRRHGAGGARAGPKVRRRRIRRARRRRAFDARRTPRYPPYDELEFEVPVLEESDVNARVWVRIREVRQSLALIEQILARLPDGAIRSEIPVGGGEGMALIEAFRGDLLVWLRLDA